MSVACGKSAAASWPVAGGKGRQQHVLAKVALARTPELLHEEELGVLGGVGHGSGPASGTRVAHRRVAGQSQAERARQGAA